MKKFELMLIATIMISGCVATQAVAKEENMSPTKQDQVTICASFRPDLTDNAGRISRTRAPIEASAPADFHVEMADYLNMVAPGKRVEYLARRQSVALERERWSGNAWDSPTSLFFQTIHACFQNHYGLTLRPEVLAYLIHHEVATTVKMYPEDYRHLFTKSDGKVRIDVRHDGLVPGDPSSPWSEMVGLFEGKLRGLVPDGIMDHMLPDFSTATAESRTASMITFMTAASPFYDYHTYTLCGIPEIRLAGQASDYRKLLNSAAQLAEVFSKHLGPYFRHLLPVLEKLAQQAEGAPIDNQFWASIYNYRSTSGTSKFNGWITAFVNYVQTKEQLVQKSAPSFDWANDGSGWDLNGLNFGSVPSQVCVAPFTWHYLGQEMKMMMAAGVLGIEVENGALMPVLSYAILHDE